MSQNIVNMIDHTLLKADATKEQILTLVEEAKQYKFASVCVNPVWVKTAAELLAETPEVKVCTVIGFPLGASTTETKAFEAKNAIENGATEVDMVINIAALKDGQDELVERDIRAVVEAAKGKALTKVIIEACLLTNEEKVTACELSVKAGADFVKTSTGFSTGGATVEDIRLMRKTVGPTIGVKASGGVRSREDALAMVEAGATRIGASSGVSIAKGELSHSNY
ncbi:deoxyribose-phosphate aldolase [Neobacillus massiliamazoniensis]|uniref:Deoxyribose-phosphate aldolase n=1 Tax=Neobacillus massiliamazoniensis TaxID=1499688 RepID=A0A0U1P057_9BACI|nr:deoxyribose-phosphate aldolase [Neobacillus massiliamazoniensis]CRK83626.1 deoxyribose-phosphate aldolase [Neobacillus massiliamazoniensis]